VHLVMLAVLQALPVSRFPVVDHPGVDPQLYATITAICASPTTDRGALLRQADRYADSLRQSDRDAELWFATACLRANLFVAGAIAHESVAMPLGVTWEQGSINALLRSLALRPTGAKAADLLARLALDDFDVDASAQIRIALERVRVGGTATPAVFRACSEFAWRVHDTTATRNCATAALAVGLDSTWQLLRLARLRFLSADTAGGNQLFQAAVAAARDSTSRLEVNWHLQWFLTPEQLNAWEHIGDSARVQWVRDQLASRDVRDARPNGARLAEHFARLEYVEEHFRMQVPRRVAAELRSGPATMEAPPLCGVVTSCNEPGGVWAEEWREYRRWQTDFDDRGVVWMRFGAPDRREQWVCPFYKCPTVREAWVYDLDGRHMLLSFENEAFDGSEDPTRLVSGVLGSYFCGVDVQRCALTSLAQADAFSRVHRNATAPSSPMVRPEDIEHVRIQDRDAISAATTSDDNSPRRERFIGTVARFHRLWDPNTGHPVALVTYAIRTSDLKSDILGDRSVAEALLSVRQWDPTAAERRDTTLRRSGFLSDSTAPRDWIGYLVIPSLPGVAAWSLTVSQSDQRLGRAFEDPGSPLSTGAIALSDLVIGAASESLRWTTPKGEVALAPFNSVNRSDTMQIYYQVRSNVSAQVHIVVAVYQSKNPRRSTAAALQLSYLSSIRPGIAEAASTFDVSRLSKGEYRIELRIEDQNHRILAARSTGVTLR
jgi:hypothetical protein